MRPPRRWSTSPQTLAELLLSSEETRRLFGHEEVRNVFLWHALEESEHKAVAFDVYRTIDASERLRVWTMKFVRAAFLGAVAVHLGLSLLGDRATFERGRFRASWRRFRRTPLMQKEMMEQLREYDRPGFHPDDRDTNALVAEWRDVLFGAEGSLNDKLAGAVA